TMSGHFDEEFFVKRWQETLEESMEECRAGHENERKDRTLTGDLELYAALREVPYCPNCGEIITPRT
ncbi:MAG: hypothetical protein HY460_02375, partial [Parcubacteria group bacterium]|nr:hypothetical protein [Parcubacteria group bacterium]